MTPPTRTPSTTTPATATAATAARRERPQQRPAVTPDLLAGLAGKLTARDRWLLGMLAEHRVLTTTQITALAFRGARRQTERRLAGLWAWRCIDRFRPHTPRGAGSAPFHWVLDDAGAAVLAATHGLTAREFGHHRSTALGIAHSQRLAHTVGTNTLLAALAAPTGGAEGSGSGRRSGTQPAPPDAGRLVAWWGERRCAAAWGDLARPDAAGTWQAPGGATLGFAVEYDTGTEALPRVAGKLADYADLAAAVGHVLPVLFWLPSIAREAALHRQLDPTGLLVATATAEHAATAGGPTQPVWRPAAPAGPGLGQRGTRQGRVTLDQLTTSWATTTRATTTRATTTGATTGTLPVATVDVGLGWPAPDPLPPRQQHPAPAGANPGGVHNGLHNGADTGTGSDSGTENDGGHQDRGRDRAGRSWRS